MQDHSDKTSVPTLSLVEQMAQAAFGFRPDPALLDWYLQEMSRTKAILDQAGQVHPRLGDVAVSDFTRLLNDGQPS